MSRLRGREIYIIAAVVAVILVVAWWFLLLNPTKQDVASLDDQIATEQTTLSQAKQDVVRLEQYKKTAPQARADIVSLSKALPGSEGMPSLLVELGKTAEDSGVDLTNISRGSTSQGAPFGVQTITLQVEGQYFDLEDFFYRLENYVEFHNTKVSATGRLLQLASVQVQTASNSGGTVTVSSPKLQTTITINAYLQPATASTGGAQ